MGPTPTCASRSARTWSVLKSRPTPEGEAVRLRLGLPPFWPLFCGLGVALFIAGSFIDGDFGTPTPSAGSSSVSLPWQYRDTSLSSNSSNRFSYSGGGSRPPDPLELDDPPPKTDRSSPLDCELASSWEPC